VKKSDREIMEILEAFDATGVAHSAAPLCGADPPLRPGPGSGQAGDGTGAAAEADRPVHGQGRGAGGAFRGQGAGRCGARAPGASDGQPTCARSLPGCASFLEILNDGVEDP
jgi:hypothetical protein